MSKKTQKNNISKLSELIKEKLINFENDINNIISKNGFFLNVKGDQLIFDLYCDSDPKDSEDIITKVLKDDTIDLKTHNKMRLDRIKEIKKSINSLENELKTLEEEK